MVAIDKDAEGSVWSETLRVDRAITLAKVWKGLRHEEQIWGQKSRIKWLKEGDRNTNFFHFVANGRRHCNYIGNLVHNGINITDPKLIKKHMLNFFKSLKKLHAQALAWIHEIRISGCRIWASVIWKLAR